MRLRRSPETERQGVEPQCLRTTRREGYARNQSGDAATAASISRIQCIARILPGKILSLLNPNSIWIDPQNGRIFGFLSAQHASGWSARNIDERDLTCSAENLRCSAPVGIAPCHAARLTLKGSRAVATGGAFRAAGRGTRGNGSLLVCSPRRGDGLLMPGRS